tara:strand:- start:636 stop:875 length:240 start_codon:yes stop_codon:yes gene_type:complete
MSQEDVIALRQELNLFRGYAAHCHSEAERIFKEIDLEKEHLRTENRDLRQQLQDAHEKQMCARAFSARVRERSCERKHS